MRLLGHGRSLGRAGAAIVLAARRGGRGLWYAGSRSLPFGIALLLLLGAFVGYLQPPRSAAQASGDLQPYQIRLARENSFVVANASADELIARDRQRRVGAVTQVLDQLGRLGDAGKYRVDLSGEVVHVALDDAARQKLLTQPQVGSIEPDTAAPAAPAALPTPKPKGLTTQACDGLSTINFVQVYSPYMWGTAKGGGLSVTLTLEDPFQNVIGVAYQTTLAPPNNYVAIDRTYLYYDTYFVDPNSIDPTSGTHPMVMVAPGDFVHVVLTGFDPTCNQNSTDDRLVSVDNIQAWTSYMNGSVTGVTTPNASLTITLSQNQVMLDDYLVPGNGVQYAQTTSDANGNFSVNKFGTNGNNGTLSAVTLTPGATGFVRVTHSNGDEVYLVHGQNVFVPENTELAHGFFFGIPLAPSGIAYGIAVPRPSQPITVTLTSPQGAVISTSTASGGPRYVASFTQMVTGGDSVTVSIQAGPIYTVTTTPINSTVDLTGNQVTGTGPANTPLIVSVGLIDGYVVPNSTFTYIEKLVTSQSNGSFASGGISCGTSTTVLLKPGSFGYTGYEDSHSNFVYENFAAPTNGVMANQPFVEGWVANGTASAAITVADSSGNIKSSLTATPMVAYLTIQQLYVNVYYNAITSQFINPGDVVTVVSNGLTSTIPVDQMTAYLDTDTDTIGGSGPTNATVRIVPDGMRSAYQTASTGSSGAWTAVNPFTNFNDSTCSTWTTTQTFTPGAFGRAYLTHADNNSVYVAWGRSMHVNENENVIDFYLFPNDGNPWLGTAAVTVNATLTPSTGNPVQSSAKSDQTVQAHATLSFVDSQANKVMIHAGANLAATFPEGPGTPSRTASFSLSNVPLIIGTPNSVANTIGGIGPNNWSGRALLNNNSGSPVAIPIRTYTSFGPSSFLSLSNALVAIPMGTSGTVSFTDSTADRVWVAWASTAVPVTISGFLKPGQTQVCGTAPANGPINIHDVTNEPQDLIIGTGSANASGSFCVTVSSLFKGQVVMAESAGTYSQPVVVGTVNPVFIPSVPH